MVKVIGHSDADLLAWMEKCVRAGGVPIIKTKYGGRSLDEIHRELRPHVVIAACWGKGKEVPGGTFEGISDELYRKIIEVKGEWKELLKPYV